MFGYDHNPWSECPYCGGRLSKHGCVNCDGGGRYSPRQIEDYIRRHQEPAKTSESAKDEGKV